MISIQSQRLYVNKQRDGGIEGERQRDLARSRRAKANEAMRSQLEPRCSTRLDFTHWPLATYAASNLTFLRLPKHRSSIKDDKILTQTSSQMAQA